MVNPFVRSTHFLQRDAFGRFPLSFLLLVVLLFVWISWFTMGSMHVFESADTGYIDSTQTLTASFTGRALASVELGQTAEIRMHDFPWGEFGLVEAQVTNVDYMGDHVLVSFDILETDPRIPLQRGMTGDVLVTVDRLSPAQMLMRSISR